MADSCSNRQLAVLQDVRRALEVARNFDEVKDLRDKAEAARQYARNAALGLELQNLAAELKLRAERKAGKFLGQLKLRGGDRKSNSQGESLKLIDLGIDRNQSSRWQKEASIPEEVFEHYLRSARLAGIEITARGLIRCNGSRGQRATTSISRCAGQGVTERGLDTSDGPYSHHGPPDGTLGVRSAGETDALLELKNHYDLLVSIVYPFLDGGTASLQRAEREHALRLVVRISDILAPLIGSDDS